MLEKAIILAGCAVGAGLALIAGIGPGTRNFRFCSLSSH